jgi:pyridoxine kinase
VQGLRPAVALGRAAAGVADLIEAAIAWNAQELPIVAAAQRLVTPAASVRLQILS